MKRRTFHYSALAGVCLSILSAAALYMLRPVDVSRDRVVFKGVRGDLTGDIYTPRTTPSNSMPGVLICHGVENNKEVTAHLAIEFARRGYVSLSFDYGGYGESTPHDDEFDTMVGDTLAALSYLANQPRVDKTRLAIVGHSMGVSYAVAAAERGGNSIKSVVGLGNEAIATQVPPRNLLLAMGLYDAFHTMPNMLAAVRESSGNDTLEPNQTHGNFSDGTARALFVSPISDHGMEPLDPLLIAESIKWVESSFAGDLVSSKFMVKESYRAEAHIFLVLASGMALTAIFFLLYLKPAENSLYQVLIRTPIVCMAFAAIIGNLSTPAIALFCTDITLVLLAAGTVAAHLSRSSRQLSERDKKEALASRTLAFGLAFVAAVVVSLLAGLLIHGVPVALSRGEWALSIPRFIFHVFLLRPYEGWCMARAYAFSSYSQGWAPEIWFGAAILIETVRPGAITWFAGKTAQTTLRAFRLKGPFKIRASGKSWIALAGVVVVLIMMLVRRFQEGWLISDAIRPMLLIALKFMLIPLLIFILLLNLPFFHRNEEEA